MYDKDYLEYDEFGLKVVGCMRCNKPVKVRRYKDVISHTGKSITVAYIKELVEFKPVALMLSNGSYTNILLCIDCAKNKENTEEERDGMTKQFRRGHELEAEYLKIGQAEIKLMADSYNKLSVTDKKATSIKVKGVV